ncbi:MAG: YdjY domain-containing protein [Planctomycetaceae bacterium]|jgi:hypothetical protein
MPQLVCTVGRSLCSWIFPGALLFGLAGGDHTTAQETAPAPPKASARPAAKGNPVPLNESGTVKLDLANRRLLVQAEVVLRQGQLEMFACRKRSKEHESIVAIDAAAFVIHSGLLALKATPGGPAVYEPKFQPPHGEKLEIFLIWQDEKGQAQRVSAQSWIRETVNRFWVKPLEKLPSGITLEESSPLRYDRKQQELVWYGPMTDSQKKELLAMSEDRAWRDAISFFHERGQSRGMRADWVFVGSVLGVDETTGEKSYAAEEGQYICVSNFPTAMIDIALRSSDQAAELAFEAWTEKIPPKGTPVTLEIGLAPARQPAPQPVKQQPAKPTTAGPNKP